MGIAHGKKKAKDVVMTEKYPGDGCYLVAKIFVEIISLHRQLSLRVN
jgi:hypothetical protein